LPPITHFRKLAAISCRSRTAGRRKSYLTHDSKSGKARAWDFPITSVAFPILL
jgi:hypothetical protein